MHHLNNEQDTTTGLVRTRHWWDGCDGQLIQQRVVQSTVKKLLNTSTLLTHVKKTAWASSITCPNNRSSWINSFTPYWAHHTHLRAGVAWGEVNYGGLPHHSAMQRALFMHSAVTDSLYWDWSLRTIEAEMATQTLKAGPYERLYG